MSSRARGVPIVAALAAWALAAPAAAAQDTPQAGFQSAPRQVIAVVPRNWPPQYGVDRDGKPVGFAIEVMEEIAARAGLEMTYRVVDDFAAVEEAMAFGQGDIVPNSGITPERAARYSFTSPVQASAISIFVRADTAGIDGLGDLAGRTVGIVESSVGEDIVGTHRHFKPVIFKDSTSAIFGLLSGRVDALIYARSVIEALARNAGVEDHLKAAGEPVMEIKRAIRVQKNRPDILAALDRAVNDFVGTSDYRAIYAKWYGKPAPFWTAYRVAWATGGLAAVILLVFAWSRYRLLIEMNRRIAASEEKFRDLIVGAVPGVLIHRGHKPLFVNRSYAEIFGHDNAEELLRQASVLDHVAPHERARLKAYAAARLRGDAVPEVYEFQGRRKDGTPIWLENRGRVVDWEGAPAIQRTVVDITEKRHAEAELMRRSSQQAVVAELGQHALLERDLTALLNAAVTLVAKILDADFGKVLELLPGGDELVLRAGAGWKPGLVGKARVTAGKHSQAGYTLLQRDPVIVADLRRETRFEAPPLLRDHGILSGVSVVIGDPKNPYGVLAVHGNNPGAFSEDDALFLKTVSAVLASAISRKRVEDALRANEERLRGAIESMQEGFVLFDADDRLVMVNNVYRRINPNAQAFLERGATFEDLIRANVENGRIADAIGREQEFIRERLAAHRRLVRPIIRRHSNGKWFVVKETDTPDGGIALTFTDITELKRAEAAMRESEERFRAVAESISDAIIAIDDEDRIVLWNNGARIVFGYEESEIMGRPLSKLMPERYRERHAAAVKRLKQGGEPRLVGQTLELAGLRKDGSEFPAEISIGAWDSRGKICFSAVIRNIAERKRADLALRENEERFRSVIDYSPAAIVITDLRGAVLIANRKYCRWLALESEDLVGKTARDLLPKEVAERTIEHERKVLETRAVVEEERRVAFPDGVTRDILVQKFPILNADGDCVAVGSIINDITARKREERRILELQVELAHVSRISTMGEMAAGLAHELNQPLTAITNYAKGTLRRLQTGGAPVDLLPIMELVAEQALRAGDIIRKIRGFMNRSEPQKSRIDLRRAIDEVMALLAGEINMSGIEVAVEMPRSLPPVMADSIQVQQVLLNLIRNAVAAMAGDGADHHRLEIGAKANGAKDVEVYVRDNGPGIPRDIKDRLFEPFFTTKIDGLGMGLSISRSIVTGHNGRIWASSETGKGATFHFTLPVGAGEAHDAA